MIVKRNLSPKAGAEYVAAPMAWSARWAIAAPVAFTVTDDERIILPFPVVATLERIAATPTLRQYDYFTRRLIELFALVAPFALLGLVADAISFTTPLALLLAGTFVVLAVTGAANDEPFANRVTDVPIDTICTQPEHDVLTATGHPDPPQPLQPVDGYL